MEEGKPMSPRVLALRRIVQVLWYTVPACLVTVFCGAALAWALMDVPHIGRSAVIVASALVVFASPAVALWRFFQAIRVPRRTVDDGGDITQQSYVCQLGFLLAMIIVCICVGVVAGPLVVGWQMDEMIATRRAAEFVSYRAHARTLMELLKVSAEGRPRTFPKSLAELVAVSPEALPELVPAPAQQERIRLAIDSHDSTATEMISAASEFEYGGSDVPLTSEKHRYVVLLSKGLSHRRIVGWSDIHVDEVEEAEVKGILQADAELRQRNGIPAVNWQIEEGDQRVVK